MGLDVLLQEHRRQGSARGDAAAAGTHAVEWPAAKNFAHVVCAQMAQDSPARYLDTMSKRTSGPNLSGLFAQRSHLHRGRAALAARAARCAPCRCRSTGARYAQGLDPKRFTVRSAPALLEKSNAWSGYGSRPVPRGRDPQDHRARPPSQTLTRPGRRSSTRPAGTPGRVTLAASPTQTVRMRSRTSPPRPDHVSPPMPRTTAPSS